MIRPAILKLWSADLGGPRNYKKKKWLQTVQKDDEKARSAVSMRLLNQKIKTQERRKMPRFRMGSSKKKKMLFKRVSSDYIIISTSVLGDSNSFPSYDFQVPHPQVPSTQPMNFFSSFRTVGVSMIM